MQADVPDYRPSQIPPTTPWERNPVCCKGFAPSRSLEPYVVSYWHIASRAALPGTLHHRVLPDGCVDIVFDLAASSPGQAAVIAGPTTKPFSVPLTRKVCYLGVCFRPGAFFRLFGVPVSELTDRIIPLAEFASLFARCPAEALHSFGNVPDQIRFIEGTLSRHLARERREDHRFTASLAAIAETAGSIRIAALARAVHTSPRNLSRLFDCYAGLAPKVLCRIVRFQKLVRRLRNIPSEKQSLLALTAGYYDQAHMIHDFQVLAGQSPTRLLGEPTG